MSDWCLNPSIHSENTANPVREAVSRIIPPTDFHKPIYSLGLGDPSCYEDFRVHPFALNAVAEKLMECNGNGYVDSSGVVEARQCLAQEFSYENIQLTVDDVVIDIAGSGAIHTVLQVFLNPGDSILIPSPGFPLYKTIALNLSAEARTYTLVPQNQWEIDFSSLEAQYDSTTKLLVLVNPSNPCGSVYSKEHLLEILSWAESKKLPILSDEVYHNMTFGKPHFPLGSLTNSVPVFTIGALSKMFLAPGWRCGWILVYDKQNRCTHLKQNLKKIKNMLLHPCPFIMQAIPNIFKNKPDNYFHEIMSKVQTRAEIVQSKLEGVKGLFVSPPEGALYTMISLDFTYLDIKDSLTFAEKFVKEQGVVIIPAEAFLSHSGFRVVLCHPVHIIEECMDRLKSFVESHNI